MLGSTTALASAFMQTSYSSEILDCFSASSNTEAYEHNENDWFPLDVCKNYPIQKLLNNFYLKV